MRSTNFEHDGVDVTEKQLSYAEAEQIYGTTNVRELNERFSEAAQRCTDGNCHQWAIYACEGITVVTEVY